MPATRTEKHAAAAPASPHDSASPEPNKPERSRNAKAQARHREKRKAYIDHVRYPDRPKIPILTPLTAPASVDRPSLPVSAAISYLISRHFNTDRPFITAREKRRPAQEPAREHGHFPRRPSQCPDINSARGGHGFQRGAAPCAVRGERAAQARNPQPPRHHRSHVVHKPLLWHRQQGWHYSARNSPPQHRPHPGRLFRNHPSSYPKALRRRGTSLGECLSSLPPFFCALLPLLPLVISRILILILIRLIPAPHRRVYGDLLILVSTFIPNRRVASMQVPRRLPSCCPPRRPQAITSPSTFLVLLVPVVSASRVSPITSRASTPPAHARDPHPHQERGLARVPCPPRIWLASVLRKMMI